MMIDTTKRRRVLALLILTSLATLFIAASLSRLQLQAGLPFPGGEGAEGNSVSQTNSYPLGSVFWSTSSTTLDILSVLFLVVSLYMIFRHAEMRRILLWVFVLCLFIGLIAVAFSDKQTIVDLSIPPQETSSNIHQVGPIGVAPTIFIWLVVGGLVLLTGIVGFWLYRTTSKVTSTKDLIKAEAKNALREIQDGKEWRNVIIRCYLQMVYVMQTKQDIERADSMTTREFERLLVIHNFPEREVHRLTTLFEKVRYGNKPVDRYDEQTAIDCLAAITGSEDI